MQSFMLEHIALCPQVRWFVRQIHNGVGCQNTNTIEVVRGGCHASNALDYTYKSSSPCRAVAPGARSYMLQSALHQHLDAVRRRHGKIGVHGQGQLAGRQLENEPLV